MLTEIRVVVACIKDTNS